METNTLTSPIVALINQFELQTRLFNNILNNVTEELGNKQAKEDTNHLAWLTGHVLSSRFMLANLIGVTDKEPHAELFAQGKGLQKDVKYPTISELRKEWNPISEKMLAKLNALTDKELSAKAPFQLPMAGNDMTAFISFMSHHEAYTIGQMGLLLRIHGLPAMKYN